ncbi:hypothetical protein BsWGS_13142 [Bradybaena similaris]
MKPPELSGRKYTEILQAQYLSSRSHLQGQHHQKTVQNLQPALQHLDKTVSLQVSSTSANAVVMQQFPDSISDKTLSALLETTNKTASHSESREISLHATANCVTLNPILEQGNTALLNDTLLGPLEVDEFREAQMLENHRFMHSVIELQGLANHKTGLENDHLLKCACKHISTLRNVISHDVMILSESCMCKGAESVMMVTDSISWIGDRPEFMQEVCSLVECIIAKLVQSSASGQPLDFSQKRVLMKMLLIFMKGKLLPLPCCILDSLVESVEIFCQELKASQLHSKAFDPDVFENGYYIIHCLELTMKQWRKDNHVHVSILQEAQEKLDSFILQIAHCFPLVAQALSRITSLIEAILQNR